MSKKLCTSQLTVRIQAVGIQLFLQLAILLNCFKAYQAQGTCYVSSFVLYEVYALILLFCMCTTRSLGAICVYDVVYIQPLLLHASMHIAYRPIAVDVI